MLDDLVSDGNRILPQYALLYSVGVEGCVGEPVDRLSEHFVSDMLHVQFPFHRESAKKINAKMPKPIAIAMRTGQLIRSGVPFLRGIRGFDRFPPSSVLRTSGTPWPCATLGYHIRGTL